MVEHGVPTELSFGEFLRPSTTSRISIQATKVFDACMLQSQIENYSLSLNTSANKLTFSITSGSFSKSSIFDISNFLSTS